MAAYFKNQKSMSRHCKNLLDLSSEVKLDLQPIFKTENIALLYEQWNI